MHGFIQNKITNRIKQYGSNAAFVQFTRAILRWLYKLERYIVFIIPAFKGYTYNDSCIALMTEERIVYAIKNGELETTQAHLLNGFLKEGSKGVFADVEGKLAGYAWIQFEGVYRFGITGKFNIPSKYAVMKNLYVFPMHRGHKVSTKLNAARLALIPAGHTPVVFIIPENKYAIRNWAQYGFRRILSVKRWRWICGSWKMCIKRLADHDEAFVLEKALQEANDK
jgi:GNAT superfamily N-acetyltransferase